MKTARRTAHAKKRVGLPIYNPEIIFFFRAAQPIVYEVVTYFCSSVEVILCWIERRRKCQTRNKISVTSKNPPEYYSG